ncbi:MAG: DNA translocase FtsK 4TM domain-containing protein, partial [Actinomycetaceae bacterium]|nr:DNA translocase FtsK 4TM domain-containing protein [Actinomycetaceae bacterium]
MADNSKGRPKKRASSTSGASRKTQTTTTRKVSKASEVSEDTGAPSVRNDAFALVILALAIVVALREWFNLSGILGGVIHHATAGLVGLLSVIVPLVFLVVALGMFRFRSSVANRRIPIGFALIIFAIAGIVHVIVQPISPVENILGIEKAGGLLGWISGGSLMSLVSVWGAVPLLVLLIIWSILYMVDTPIYEAVNKVRFFFFPSDDDDYVGENANLGVSASIPYSPNEAYEEEDKPSNRRLLKRAKAENTDADTDAVKTVKKTAQPSKAQEAKKTGSDQETRVLPPPDLPEKAPQGTQLALNPNV